MGCERVDAWGALVPSLAQGPLEKKEISLPLCDQWSGWFWGRQLSFDCHLPGPDHLGATGKGRLRSFPARAVAISAATGVLWESP